MVYYKLDYMACSKPNSSHHQQTGCSFHLKVVFVFFYSWEVCDVLYSESSSRFFTMVLGHPITLFGLRPRRTAAIWGFLEAGSPTEAVMVSPRMTPVTSRFNLLTEMVTIRTYCLSSLVWLHGMGGPVSSTTDPVMGAINAIVLMGLVAWLVSMPCEVPTSGSTRIGMVPLSSGASVQPGGVWPTLTAVGKRITCGAFSTGGKGVVLCAPGAATESDLLPLMLIGVGWVMGHPWGLPDLCPQLLGQLSPGSRGCPIYRMLCAPSLTASTLWNLLPGGSHPGVLAG